jgi:hypothetical protein
MAVPNYLGAKFELMILVSQQKADSSTLSAFLTD